MLRALRTDAQRKGPPAPRPRSQKNMSWRTVWDVIVELGLGRALMGLFTVFSFCQVLLKLSAFRNVYYGFAAMYSANAQHLLSDVCMDNAKRLAQVGLHSCDAAEEYITTWPFWRAVLSFAAEYCGEFRSWAGFVAKIFVTVMTVMTVYSIKYVKNIRDKSRDQVMFAIPDSHVRVKLD